MIEVRILVDAGRQVGLGHLCRCLAVATELRRRGAPVVVSGRIERPADELIIAAGLEYRALPSSIDADADADALVGAGTCVAIVDLAPGAAIERYEAIAARCERLVVLVDRDRRELPGQVIVDATLQALERPPRPRETGGVVLVGPGHAPMDAAFSTARAAAAPVGELARILVTMGGTDLAGASGWIADALAAPGRTIVPVRGVAPAAMADLLAAADLVVCPGGTTAYQAACVGAPMLLVPQVASQLDSAGRIAATGAARLVGLADEVDAAAIAVAAAAVEAAPIRTAMRAAGRALCDGRGAARIADAIGAL